MKKLFVALIIVGVGFGVVILWEVLSFLFVAPGSESEKHVFEVSPGQSFIRTAKALEERQLISNSFKFHVLAKFTGQTTNIRVGEYALHGGMRPSEVLSVLVSGKSIEYPFTVSEGLNVFEIAELLQAKNLGDKGRFLSLVKDPKLIEELLGESGISSLEGYLFPETYRLTKFTTEATLIRRMVQNFMNVYNRVIPSSFKQFSRHEIVTLASVIEKETGAPDERPLISSVFQNRLRKRMRLQSDPTIIYGIWSQTERPVLNITKRDITTPTKYNTYTVAALPYGPIANPGSESLRAVVNPEPSEYLYFVSRNDGTHVFSRTYEEHLSAVRKFQLDRRAREGKSWRDLNKSQSK